MWNGTPFCNSPKDTLQLLRQRFYVSISRSVVQCDRIIVTKHFFARLMYTSVTEKSITETWLTNNIPDSVVLMIEFSLVRKDRGDDRRDCGVCAYIKSSIGFTTIDELNNSSFESLWLYLRPNRLPRGFSCLIIGVIYHPPLEDDTNFTEHLISSLNSALIKYPMQRWNYASW